MQELSNGKERVVVEGNSFPHAATFNRNGRGRRVGNTVRQVIENLEERYPGFRERLIDQNRVKPNIAVAIDGEITPLGLIGKVSEASEVHFLPAISGG